MESSFSDIHQMIDELPAPTRQITSFSESVRTRQKFALNELNGHRSCNLIIMGKIALRLVRNLQFDPVNQMFIDTVGAYSIILQPQCGNSTIYYFFDTYTI